MLRARLILEEALEVVEALGVEVSMGPLRVTLDKLKFYIVDSVNLAEVIKECCDVKVVTTGTLSVFGIPDNLFQDMVDLNNLQKFGPDGHRDKETGKWIKPRNHPKPPVSEFLDILSRVQGGRKL